MLKKLLKPKIALVLTLIAFALLFVTNAEPYLRSDEWCYYTISKNIIDKNSFVSDTRPEYFDYMEHVKETYNGKYISVCSPGTALIQLPNLIVANFFKGDKTIYNDYFMAYNGHTIWEGIASVFTAMFAGITSLILIYKILRHLKFSERNSVVTTGLTFICSYAVWYIFLNSSFTHIYEILCLTSVIFFFLKSKGSKRYSLLLGIGIGLMILVRPTLLPVALLIGIYLLFNKRFNDLFYLIVGGFPELIIFLVYNYVSYGSALSTGYSTVRSENFAFTTFNGLNVILSPYRGWLVYSPIFIFAIIGLVILLKRYRFLARLSILGIASGVIIYGFWPSWWGGGSYGQRFLLYALPFCAIGLANFFSFIKTKGYKNFVYVLVFLTFIYSAGLVVAYRFSPASKVSTPFEGKIDGMYSVERYTPLDIYSYQFNLIKNSSSLSNYGGNLYRSINGGSGILAIGLGISNGVLRVDDRNDVLKFHFLKSPFMRRDFPESTSGYYKNNKNGKIYKFVINNLQDGLLIQFNCDFSECSSLTENMRLEETMEIPESFPIDQYAAILVSSGKLIFKYEKNLQYRGLPEDVSLGTKSYTL